MGKQHETKLVRHGMYVAEVDVELVYTNDAWSPYLTVDDAKRLDEVLGKPCGEEIWKALQGMDKSIS